MYQTTAAAFSSLSLFEPTVLEMVRNNGPVEYLSQQKFNMKVFLPLGRISGRILGWASHVTLLIPI